MTSCAGPDDPWKPKDQVREDRWKNRFVDQM